MGERRRKGNSIKEKTSIEAPADNRIRVLGSGELPCTYLAIVPLCKNSARKGGATRLTPPVQKGFNARPLPR